MRQVVWTSHFPVPFFLTPDYASYLHLLLLQNILKIARLCHIPIDFHHFTNNVFSPFPAPFSPYFQFLPPWTTLIYPHIHTHINFALTLTSFFPHQMLMDPMGGIVMTNDGNAILREVRSLPIFSEHLHVYFLQKLNNLFLIRLDD